MTEIDKLIEEIHKGKHGWDGDWHSHIAEPIIRAAMPGILQEFLDWYNAEYKNKTVAAYLKQSEAGE